MLLSHLGNHVHLFLGQGYTGGIAGVGDHDSPGIGRDQSLDTLPDRIAIALLRTGGQRTDGATGGMDESSIVGIVRLGDNDLGIRVQDAQAHQQQSFAATGGNEHIGRIQLHAQTILIIATDGIDQYGHAGRCGISQDFLTEILDSIIENLRGLQIRLADIQMIDLLAGFLGRYSQRMEHTHRRGFTTIRIDGNFHKFLRVNSFYIVS